MDYQTEQRNNQNETDEMDEIDEMIDELELEEMNEYEMNEMSEELDVTNIKGVGKKTAEILYKYNINTVEEFFNVLQNNESIVQELKNQIRGFNKISDAVMEMSKKI